MELSKILENKISVRAYEIIHEILENKPLSLEYCHFDSLKIGYDETIKRSGAISQWINKNPRLDINDRVV
ncbi:6917_t:CDS:1, partial [Racocetra persica]